MKYMMDLKKITSKHQSLLFQNLVALGFDVSSVEQEHKIKFDKKIFCLPNQKAFEIMSYFLFCKLNEVSSKKYVIPWPLLDVKAHREYYKICFNHLSSIAQESSIKFPLVSSSVLSSYGDPFYELFFAFSTHVVLATNQQYGALMLKRPKADSKFYEDTLNIMQISITASVSKFADVTVLTKHFVSDCLNCSSNLISSSNKLEMSITSNKSLLKEKNKTLRNLYSVYDKDVENQSEEDIVHNIMDYQRKIKECIDYLHHSFSKEDQCWSYISSELDEAYSKPFLVGNSFNCCISTSLLDKYSKNSETKKTEENQDLCIPRCLQILDVALNLYYGKLKQSSFLNTQWCHSAEEICSIKNCIAKLTHLNASLENKNEEERSHIEKVLHDLSVQMENFFIEFDLPPSFTVFDSKKNSMQVLSKLEFFENSSADINLENLNYISETEEDYSFSMHTKTNDDSEITSFEFETKEDIENVDYRKFNKDLYTENNINLLSKQPIDKFIEADSMTCNETFEDKTIYTQTSKQDYDSGLPPNFFLEESLNSQSLIDVSLLDE